MKKTLCTLLCVIPVVMATFHARAQVANHHSINSAPGLPRPVWMRSPTVYNIISKQYQRAGKNIASRTTSPGGERLIATSSYNFDSASAPIGLTDTAAFSYSGLGSAFNTFSAGYFYPSLNWFSTQSAETQGYLGGFIGHFSPDINLSDILADSAWYWQMRPDSTGNWALFETGQVYNVYSGTNVAFCSDEENPGQIDSMWMEGNNTYNTFGNITNVSVTQFGLFYPGWNRSQDIFYYYNSVNQLTEDSSGAYSMTGMALYGWIPDVIDYYTYDTSGNLIYSSQWVYSGGTIQEYMRFYFAYDAGNNILVDSMQENVSGVWTTIQADSFGYTPGISYWTFLKTSQQSVNLFLNKHINAANLPDTMYQMEYGPGSAFTNGFLGGQRIAIEYDALNNPVTEYANPFNVTNTTTGDGSFVPFISGMLHFYYQSALSVAGTQRPGSAVTVCPNPTTGNCSLLISGLQNGERVNMRLTDQLGATVMNCTSTWQNQYLNLAMQTLRPGIYILILGGERGEIWPSVKVVKE